MSSRIAVCGQQPVRTGVIRSTVEHARPLQEVGVFGGVDVVGHDREVELVSQRPAERGHQRGLAAADRPADADPQCPARARRDGVLVRPVLVRTGTVVMVKTQRVSPPLGCALRPAGRGPERTDRATRRAGRPQLRRRARHLVDVAGEPGQYGGGPHRVEGKQAHRRAGRPGHRLVSGDPRRVPTRRIRPRPQPPRAQPHDAPRPGTPRSRRPPPSAWSSCRRPCGRPRRLPAGGRSRHGWPRAPPGRRHPARPPGPRAAAPAPAAATPPAAQATGSGHRPRRRSAPQKSKRVTGNHPLVPVPVHQEHAAAASPAATSPAVRSRPRRNASRVARSLTVPAVTAGSTPPEWACPPAGNRESDNSNAATLTGGPYPASRMRISGRPGRARMRIWHSGVPWLEEEVALGHRELRGRGGFDRLAVDADGEGVRVDRDVRHGVVVDQVRLARGRIRRPPGRDRERGRADRPVRPPARPGRRTTAKSARAPSRRRPTSGGAEPAAGWGSTRWRRPSPPRRRTRP